MLSESEWKHGLSDGLTDAAIDITERARDYAPVATGRLIRTIRPWGHMSGLTRIIVAGSSDVVYARPQEMGSGIHGSRRRKYAIRPKRGKYLRIPSQTMLTQRRGSRAVLKQRKTGRVAASTQRRYGNDAYVFKKMVMHPGVKAQRFMRRALHESPVPDMLAKALVRMWRSHGAT